MVGCVDSSADGIAYGWRLLCATANHGLRVLLGDIRVRMVRRLVLMKTCQCKYHNRSKYNRRAARRHFKDQLAREEAKRWTLEHPGETFMLIGPNSKEVYVNGKLKWHEDTRTGVKTECW
jgi:hypothetical protein